MKNNIKFNDVVLFLGKEEEHLKNNVPYLVCGFLNIGTREIFEDGDYIVQLRNVDGYMYSAPIRDVRVCEIKLNNSEQSNV